MPDSTDVARSCMASIVAAAPTVWINSLVFPWVHAVALRRFEEFQEALLTSSDLIVVFLHLAVAR